MASSSSAIRAPALRSLLSTLLRTNALSSSTRRSFQTSARRCAEAVTPLPVRKPVGAFRGGLLGFFLGSSVTGASVYYYVLDEYKVSNELLTEDIYSLQNSVQRVHTYVSTLEDKITELEKKKK